MNKKSAVIRIDVSKQENEDCRIIITDTTHTSSSNIHIEILSMINSDAPI